jgi:type I restriction enzyme, S subunit
MPLKQFTTDFQDLAKEKSFRYDVDFVDFQNEFLVEQYYSFTDLFQFQKGNKVDIEKLDDDFLYAEIGNVSKEGDIEPVKLNFSERKEEEENYYKKIEKGDIIKARENDILLSKVRPNLKKYVFINEDTKNYFYTSAFIHLIPRKLNKILYYSFRTIFYENLIAISRQGKGYPTLKEDDFLYLKFDKKIVDKFSEKQDQIVAQIEPIEKKIKQLKSQITPPQEIINKVFSREFDFDENLFNEFGKGMTAGTQFAQNRTLRAFKTDFEELSRSGIVRFSTRFHNPPTKKLMDFLNSIKTLQVKDIVRGFEKGIQPTYNPDGEIPVVKIANLKNGYIDFLEPEFVTQEYYNKLEERKKLKRGDIIICATGKISLGKIDYYNYGQESITTVDNYILRLKENCNSLFFTYFFRSVLGYFQIERDFTGATNQIHLYWDEISNFKIPDIPLKFQQKIVDEIKVGLEKQEEVIKKIQTERNKIDEIIEEAIK